MPPTSSSAHTRTTARHHTRPAGSLTAATAEARRSSGVRHHEPVAQACGWLSYSWVAGTAWRVSERERRARARSLQLCTFMTTAHFGALRGPPSACSKFLHVWTIRTPGSPRQRSRVSHGPPWLDLEQSSKCMDPRPEGQKKKCQSCNEQSLKKQEVSGQPGSCTSCWL